MPRNSQNDRQKSRPFSFLLLIVCSCSIFLTGCVSYDVGINFNSPYNGSIVQRVKVARQINNLDRSDLKKWFNSIESRSRQLAGKVKKLNNEELLVTVPFSNGKELETKFNQLFHSEIPVTSAVNTGENPDLTELDSRITLAQSNLVFFERNSFDAIVDLRALNILTRQSKIAVESDRLIDLELALKTPWIAYSVPGEENLQPVNNFGNKRLVWHLQPGAINHIEAVFWLPSPLGIGAAVIILLVIVGFYLKYRRFPGVVS